MTSETIITNKIKYFQSEYPDGVPLNILKLDLDLSVEELQKNLLSLEEQGILFIEDEEYVKLVECSPEDDSEESEKLDTPPAEKQSVNEKEIKYELTEREIEALEIIKELTDDSNHISRHILEGELLYGDLKLSSLGVYKIVMSFENKGIIKKILVNESEYYVFND